MLTNPDGVLPAMLNGGKRAIELTLTMLAVYTVWLGVLNVAQECGITNKLSKILKKPIRLLFGKIERDAEESLAMNISANVLGMGGVATPMGIRTATLLDSTNNHFAMDMLLVTSATSIQLLPTSIISLRIQAGSGNPSDIFLPALLSTIISTAVGICLLHAINGKYKR